jgi:hypothetical protein
MQGGPPIFGIGLEPVTKVYARRVFENRFGALSLEAIKTGPPNIRQKMLN